jgi:hypothetical protein
MFPIKGATCPAKFNGLAAKLVRYFNDDAAMEKGLTINDYESLNVNPELILYEGYHILGRGGEIDIRERDTSGASFLEEKIKTGNITEIGVVIEKTAAQKWLGRIGKFLIMGGFMLVLVIILGLVIGISIAMKNC